MRLNEDDRAWYEAYLDTPFGTPSAASPREAMRVPGCCVKSRRTDAAQPAEFGRLVEFSSDVRVVVRSHGDRTSRCVWTGTSAEYYAMWECD